MHSYLKDTKFIIAFSTWWFAWAQLQAIVLHRFGLPFSEAVIDSLISNLLLAGACLLIGMNMQYYLPRKEKFWYILLVSSVLSVAWLFISKFFLSLNFSDDIIYMQMLEKSLLIRFASGFLVTGCMAMISLIWYTQKEQKEMDERKTETEALAKEAELFKLRQQLQPHFLFNSLNSISALTGTQPEKARHMIQQLSDFLRGTLKKDEKQWNTLKEELEYLSLYLDIEKVRFGHRLQTQINPEESTLQMKLPALLLQPVVENAIKFGLYDTTGEVLIEIHAEKENEHLKITVQNPCDPETAMPVKGTGFGLSSVQRRLYLLFARPNLLHTQSENNIFTTTIIIPQ